jgi:hypothetical protein
MTPAELDRAATIAATIRPDWPIASLKTWFAKWHQTNDHRGYVDTLHAIVACYLDPRTSTPARLSEAGPWWRSAPTTEPERKITAGPEATVCHKPVAADDGTPSRCLRLIYPDEPHTCRQTRRSPQVEAEIAEARRRADEATERIRREADERAREAMA